MDNNRFQSVVPAIAAGLPQPKPPGRKSNIIHYDQDFFRLNLEIMGESTKRFPCTVHVTKRFYQENIAPLPHLGAPGSRPRKVYSFFFRKRIDHNESHIMPRTAILKPGISQASHETQISHGLL